MRGLFMKVIAIAQLSDTEERNVFFRLKFRIFRSDDTESQKINGTTNRYQTKLSEFNKDNKNFSFFTVLRD